MREQNGDMKEQLDAYKKRLQTTEEKLTNMKLKNKSLKRELNEMIQKADVIEITQTENFIDCNPKDWSISRNSSDDENQ